jgi:hypothetical protein
MMINLLSLTVSSSCSWGPFRKTPKRPKEPGRGETSREKKKKWRRAWAAIPLRRWKMEKRKPCPPESSRHEFVFILQCIPYRAFIWGMCYGAGLQLYMGDVLRRWLSQNFSKVHLMVVFNNNEWWLFKHTMNVLRR